MIRYRLKERISDKEFAEGRRITLEEVASATAALLADAGSTGPLLVSAGGGVSPGTRIENLQAMAEVVGQS